MTVFLHYLLKVLLCSGILFFYYHVALRNKLFHQWNRFYLLFVVVLSLLLPFTQFTYTGKEKETLESWLWLQSLQSADNTLEEFIIDNQKKSSPEEWILLIYGGACLFFLCRFLLSLLRIKKIIQSHPVQLVNKIRFVNTNVPGTPFSFFRYIFWNRDISLQTETGQQIFQHEQVHVEEGHSIDKIFLQLVLTLFWCNPFFWLIRKELHNLHEFIADQKAVADGNTGAFAAMILQAAYPQQFTSIINPFFQTSIKRRIAMLTKNQKSGLSYLSRLAALPLIATTFFAFSVRTEKGSVNPQAGGAEEQNIISILQPGNPVLTDTLPKKKKEISSVDVKKNNDKKVSEITITYADGTKETMSGEEAQRKGLIKSADFGTPEQTQTTKGQTIRINEIKKYEIQPLVILNGKEITNEEMKKIDHNSIKSVNVLKNQSALEKYGERGRNGVIEITLKSSNLNAQEVDKNTVFEKAEEAASIDQKIWRKFLEENTGTLVREIGKQVPTGNYTVNVRFIVNQDGSLSDFTSLNDPGYNIASKILNIMKNAPNWEPAKQNGRLVRSYHTQPITLIISDNTESR